MQRLAPFYSFKVLRWSEMERIVEDASRTLTFVTREGYHIALGLKAADLQNCHKRGERGFYSFGGGG